MDTVIHLNDVFFKHYFLTGGLFLSYLLYRILYSILDDNNYIRTQYKTRGHTWRSIQCNTPLPFNILCSNCGKLMLTVVGLFCECCGVSACKRCHRTIDKKFNCKPVSWPTSKPFYHHWVQVGTAHSENVDEGYKKYFCCWCRRSEARRSPPADAQECDFQKYKHIIIPPTSVILGKKGDVAKIIPPADGDWEPIIVLANPKSGSNRSDEVLSIFRGVLNPVQVVDMSVSSPERVVRWLPARCRLVVAGGDGTVSWVLSALGAAPHVQAAVSILPMGTGNDLSRVLGWGAGCDSDLNVDSIISAVEQATPQLLDRWRVTVTPHRRRLGRLQAQRVLLAYNYLSVGVDAQVALDFHRARAHFLHRYASRTLNYVAYLFLGVGRALDDGGCEGLERRLRVWVEGAARPLALPPLQALVVLNVPSWGAGVDLWSMGDEEDVGEQSICDGQLEVVGVSSSFHIARLQCGLAAPYRFTQARRLQIELEGSCAMQVDGEPWMQGAATITVEPAGQSLVLRNARADR